MTDALPIEPVLEDLWQALRAGGVAVLQAPPGAGKTTRVPLALLERGITGRILMLEPRRLAARAAAERMAAMLGEPVGQTVGYRMRGETKISRTTRIEVITEGILTRMIQSDPALEGVGTVVFDEFHERSLNGDLGLALVWEVRGALRDDLNVLVMSATLDAAPVARMLDDAPVITSEGRAFPVETRWLPRPLAAGIWFERAMSDLIQQALAETSGGVLVFLPGEGEIRRVANALTLPDGVQIRPLYGALPFAEQRAAIAPAQTGRKVVLATSIAETSLTIEDVRVVVDGGRARRARYDPGAGLSRLITERVSRAEADQRRGRAGRVAKGICYRLWAKAEEGALPAFPPAEIEAADLAGLALELCLWGAAPDDLAFLTPPPEGAFANARALLQRLGALDAAGRLTDHGKTIAAMPVHPRLAHMLAHAGPDAAQLAALLSDRDLLGRSAGADLALRMRALQDNTGDAKARARIKAEAKRLAKWAKGPARSLGEMTALAYPDRIGLRRSGEAPRYLLSGGRGAQLTDGDALSGARALVAADLDGDGRDTKIRLAAQITESEIRDLYADQIERVTTCDWSRRDKRVLARQQERLGALILSDRSWKDAPEDAVTEALIDGVRDLGLDALNWTKPARLLRARVRLLFGTPGIPDWSDPALLDDLNTWLAPYLGGLKTAADLKTAPLLTALQTALGWDGQQTLDRLAPPSFETPLGRKVAVDYSGEVPEISVRLQELFGETTHPTVGGTPLKVTLLSPAGRPVQVTRDLPGFWASSYDDVRKDMRGRYPKHPWPEDPTAADPTLRAKRRK
ncbi:ATP-dependent helicase HrpB [Litoreibacter roseus]|uniref:DEAD/DEAH box helicase n=1 Tax=Litoreibacter roseus TaxID=2601869 RepID=A0A6N6JDV3_9RHOB|nr:ATP-dependent helicase HrpB [Litoreibacter roseus]GFE63468.1 DEAD/DEAH box helicase [Litoreibacter roseus]